ncbi:heavy metal translocating P-type ATPase [Aciditerrimonas ferrireducens]|uniref:heavy metal translocating P-type ATPase n=1 Tax=Aciditerrimonas ferrireducens TaxID=667306 RepID=UPI0020063518|nr:heavy metal translocating P-type ATPase [Aciditerrimonas ferrireducens]MCK4176761.1 cadmium-translocating P-type ATPase [Aciditerrimonas ferrireducens]
MSHTATCGPDHAHVAAADPGPAEHGGNARGPARRLVVLREVREVPLAAAALLAFLGALALRAWGAPAVADAALGACLVVGGLEPTRAGLAALRARRLDVDLLMVVAALVAVAIGQALDGALLVVIFATSGALEALATRRTEEAVRSLLTLVPAVAHRLRPEGDEEVVPVQALAEGDRIRVRPGDRLPLDGRVVAGRSEVDEASLTGEGLPVPKGVGNEVLAGTTNGSGTLVVAVRGSASTSLLARIAAQVEEAASTKARTQLFVERLEQGYSLAVVGSTLVLLALPLALGAALRPTLLRAMTFMIVASPCAVVLATMPPLLAAIASAGRHRVLVKSAVALERLGGLTQVAFDKTGTLTEGRPRLVAIRPLYPGVGEEELLRLAGAVETASEHPLGAAVVAEARIRGLSLPEATDFGVRPGIGAEAEVAGQRVAVGRPALVDPHDPARAVLAELGSVGRTVSVVLLDGRPAGALVFADPLRPEAAPALAALRRMLPDPPVLVTGDQEPAAWAVADAVGIEVVRAGLLPDEKLAVVEALEQAGARVGMVGDGINDGPALARGHVGIAMGGRGSDLALQSADLVVANDDLLALPAVLGLARQANRLVRANLAFAAAVIVALVVLDLLGHLPLPLGVAAHEGSTVVVGLNGLRLLRSRHWGAGPQARSSGPRGGLSRPRAARRSPRGLGGVSLGRAEPSARRDGSSPGSAAMRCDRASGPSRRTPQPPGTPGHP